MSETRTCAGCDAPLPPNRGPGRPRKWCSDRCRKATLYRGTCVFCGGRTDGSNGPSAAPDVCRVCYRTRLAWTREKVIAAVQRWTDEHGGIPPSSLDWGNQGARHPDRTPEFPCAETVRSHFGTFNAAIVAAGFEPRTRHAHRFADIDAITARIRNGEAVADIAADLGTTDENVRVALHRRGLRVRDLRRAAA